MNCILNFSVWCKGSCIDDAESIVQNREREGR